MPRLSDVACACIGGFEDLYGRGLRREILESGAHLTENGAKDQLAAGVAQRLLDFDQGMEHGRFGARIDVTELDNVFRRCRVDLAGDKNLIALSRREAEVGDAGVADRCLLEERRKEIFFS